MKALIQDRTVLQSVRPPEVAAYLRSLGWAAVREQAGQFSVWEKHDPEGTFEVVLPLDVRYRDYALRIADLLGTLQIAEERPQPEILSDIQTTGADVVRVRFQRSESEDGTVALDQGVSLLENASDLMLASACATLGTRSFYAASKPEQAREYVRRLRLGQSEVGSYVLRILCPVPPLLQGEQILLSGQPEAPFERLVTRNMIRSLTALRGAADEAINSGKLEAFQKAVKFGVSANLCSSVVNMAGPTCSARDSLTISVNWARSRPLEIEIPKEVVFPGDRFPIIEEAARWFKATAPREDVEARGMVVRLQRKDETGPPEGPVTLLCIVDGETRRVVASLDAEDHQTALRAYEESATIRCTGDLVRAGNVFTLRNVKEFAIVAEEGSVNNPAERTS